MIHGMTLSEMLLMNNPDLSFYPPEMAAALRSHWVAGGHPVDGLPEDRALEVLFDRMYQASLLQEEGEPVKCRIIIASPESLAGNDEVTSLDLVVLRFSDVRPLTPHDIRKLAAAAGYYRALLAVDAHHPDGPAIWGMVVTGTKWVNRFGGDRYDEVPLPPRLVLQILSPGHLIAACGYSRVFETSGGRLLTEGLDPFRSTWLSERFGALRASLLDELQENLPSPNSTQLCGFFVRDVAQSVIRRVLSLVRTRGHGGMLVYLPSGNEAAVSIDRWFRFRGQFAEVDSTQWFRSLLARLIQRVLEVGSGLGLPICRWSDYRQMHDPELAVLDDALIGFGHSLADLMSVDGSLVLDYNFRLVGFGGEILGESHVREIHRACDLEAEQVIIEPADTAGTRHRSAFRLVNGSPEAIALVVSQDGDVRFVAHHRQRLTYWPYLP